MIDANKLQYFTMAAWMRGYASGLDEYQHKTLVFKLNKAADMLEKGDFDPVEKVIKDFTAAATERMGGDVRKVPVIGMRAENPGQVEFSVTVEPLPQQTRDDAVRCGRLPVPELAITGDGIGNTVLRLQLIE